MESRRQACAGHSHGDRCESSDRRSFACIGRSVSVCIICLFLFPSSFFRKKTKGNTCNLVSLMYQRPIHTFLVARIVTSDLQLCQSFCSKTFSLFSFFFFSLFPSSSSSSSSSSSTYLALLALSQVHVYCNAQRQRLHLHVG